MDNEQWLQDLRRLLGRFSGMCINPDIPAMALCELWGVYCLLKRLAGNSE